ncbi:hypothetical protein PHO31112_04926 [Pandoraea horticolens]|uniref:Uncharacterized protein n=1 Tax=Pandoraea horticolens TaxID=2508298 RepID=A0A5E4YZQ1_9BURK|nr:hypothetical protein PHO31112_04926 [Pandoraea horticolens]
MEALNQHLSRCLRPVALRAFDRCRWHASPEFRGAAIVGPRSTSRQRTHRHATPVPLACPALRQVLLLLGGEMGVEADSTTCQRTHRYTTPVPLACPVLRQVLLLLVDERDVEADSTACQRTRRYATPVFLACPALRQVLLLLVDERDVEADSTACQRTHRYATPVFLACPALRQVLLLLVGERDVEADSTACRMTHRPDIPHARWRSASAAAVRFVGVVLRLMQPLRAGGTEPVRRKWEAWRCLIEVLVRDVPAIARWPIAGSLTVT